MNPATLSNNMDTDRFLALATRADGRKVGTPPWAWANLSTQDAAWLDVALDGFVDAYNRVYATRVDEVIPRCWRLHPPLTHELPVQYWAWWAAHTDEDSTVITALDYYNRNLPAFQDRLRIRLLGPGATACRKGQHNVRDDRELTDAIRHSTQPAET
ncbi:hypothetical protein [Nakamurella endophytica]|uniref:DUF4913 domain-containing protein n=1 Tax=Nakamurella endophytica TaxID=1748367 RepID=A0A917TCT2_9ACTN|nr:hypothetical protein [Nakamurella endophytica]GGM15868.1 hypothetical protein GCM10011594_39880 [Nakamurella endophytica]